MTTQTTIRTSRGFPRVEALTPEQLRAIGIHEVRGYPRAETTEVREWIPGVTGPHGWYDDEAVRRIAEERNIRIGKITDRIVGVIILSGVGMGLSFFYWLYVNILEPIVLS